MDAPWRGSLPARSFRYGRQESAGQPGSLHGMRASQKNCITNAISVQKRCGLRFGNDPCGAARKTGSGV
jgi:hypothetical protein